MKNQCLWIPFMMIIFVSGCGLSTHYLQEGVYASKYEKVDFEEVKLYAVEEVDGKYEVIGSIAVYSVSTEGAKKRLQKRAASLGANAVLNVRLSKIRSNLKGCGLSGTAIRIVE